MSVHNVAADNLETALMQLVRGGQQIDAISTDADGNWLVVTVDRDYETRVSHGPYNPSHGDDCGFCAARRRPMPIGGGS